MTSSERQGGLVEQNNPPVPMGTKTPEPLHLLLFSRWVLSLLAFRDEAQRTINCWKRADGAAR